jgi:hypothetical protein
MAIAIALFEGPRLPIAIACDCGACIPQSPIAIAIADEIPQSQNTDRMYCTGCIILYQQYFVQCSKVTFFYHCTLVFLKRDLSSDPFNILFPFILNRTRESTD